MFSIIYCLVFNSFGTVVGLTRLHIFKLLQHVITSFECRDIKREHVKLCGQFLRSRARRPTEYQTTRHGRLSKRITMRYSRALVHEEPEIKALCDVTRSIFMLAHTCRGHYLSLEYQGPREEPGFVASVWSSTTFSNLIPSP